MKSQIKLRKILALMLVFCICFLVIGDKNNNDIMTFAEEEMSVAGEVSDASIVNDTSITENESVSDISAIEKASLVNEIDNTDEASEIPKKLKILAVGNSLSYNTLFYVYDIAKKLGVEDVVVGNLYIGSCSLKKHWNNAKKNKRAYSYHKNTDGEFKVTKKVSIKMALKDEDWDYIMLSQYSGHAGIPKTYKPLNKLIKYIRKYVNEDSKILWNMLWSYSSKYEADAFAEYNYSPKRMYKRIVKTTKLKIKNNKRIAMIIPSGTIIQNLRKTSYGEKFTTDGRHLTNRACYAVGLNLVSRILEIKPSKIKYRPKGISKKFRRYAIKSANAAKDKPFKVTKIQ